MTFMPGLCSVTFRALPPEEVIRLAARANLSAIEWGGDVHVPPGDTERAAAIAAATRAAGLAVPSYGSYLRPPVASAEDVDAVLATAKALGAPLVRVWAGRKDRPSADYSDPERVATAAAIAALAQRAAGDSLSVGLEFHPGTLTDSTHSAVRLMEALAGVPNVYLYWQPRPGLDEASGLTEIARVREHLAHLHVFNWDDRSVRYPLAGTTAVWRRWCHAATPGRWAGARYAMIEFVVDDCAARFREDADALRSILASDGP